jgi:hypothetical protein
MLLGLKWIRLIVAQLDQKLPSSEPGHRCRSRMHMINAGWLDRHIQRRRSNVLCVSSALPEAGKANHAENFVADGELRHVRRDRFDNSRHVRAWNQGQGNRWAPFGRKSLHPVSDVPVGRIDANCMDTNEHLTRP